MQAITFRMPNMMLPQAQAFQVNNFANNVAPMNVFAAQNSIGANFGSIQNFQMPSFNLIAIFANMMANFRPMNYQVPSQQFAQTQTQTQAQAQVQAYQPAQFGMLTAAKINALSKNNATAVSTFSIKQSAKVKELIANSSNSQIIDAKNAKVSENGLNLLKQFDKVHLTAYKDTGKYYSIGYGHNGPSVKPGDTCTLEEAEATLRKDMEKYTKNVASKVKVPLTQNQLDALAVFAHNVGNGAFNKSTLLKKLNAGDYVGAANELDRWIHADGKALKGLAKRRDAEKQLFLKDVRLA